MFVRILFFLGSIVMASAVGFAPMAAAKTGTQNKYASIIIDHDTLEVLHARKIDSARYPASLTKMMTLYLTFDALNRGEIRLNEKMYISANAARTPPVKLGLKTGSTITVNEAIQALAVRSANDAAVVLAERLGGSEAEFATQMTMKAKALGMQSTIFQNPHGLPNPAQTSTARDMAKLAEALLRNHANYYPYFSQRSFAYKGRTYNNHNALLGTVNGVDGFKTGYTRASGYNLVLSAERDGRRIIAVVMGGASGKSRNQHMADLIERGFDVMAQKNATRNMVNTPLLTADIKPFTAQRSTSPPPDRVQAFTLRAASGQAQDTVRIVRGAENMRLPAQTGVNSWTVQIGTYPTEFHAGQANAGLLSEPDFQFTQAVPEIIPVSRNSQLFFRARIGGITHKQANSVCKTLASRRQSCLVIAPS